MSDEKVVLKNTIRVLDQEGNEKASASSEGAVILACIGQYEEGDKIVPSVIPVNAYHIHSPCYQIPFIIVLAANKGHRTVLRMVQSFGKSGCSLLCLESGAGFLGKAGKAGYGDRIRGRCDCRNSRNCSRNVQ